MKKYVILILSSLIILSSIASAKIYKWVDSTGKTIYSENPPPHTIKGKEIKIAPFSKMAKHPYRPKTKQEKADKEEDEELEKDKKEKKVSSQEKAAKRNQEKIRKANCARAKKSYRHYSRAYVGDNKLLPTRKNKNGNTVIVSVDESKQRKRQAAQRVRLYCRGR